MHIKLTRKGFTIIEVVLVLAIAGLIFLMVFVAFPTLQRSYRDGSCRYDVSISSAAVRKYLSNNHGQGPPSSGSVKSSSQCDDDERKGIEWEDGNDSPELRRYLTDWC